MTAIYNPWGGMGNVSPSSVTGETPWARFNNTGDSTFKDGLAPREEPPSNVVSPGSLATGRRSAWFTPDMLRDQQWAGRMSDEDLVRMDEMTRREPFKMPGVSDKSPLPFMKRNTTPLDNITTRNNENFEKYRKAMNTPEGRADILNWGISTGFLQPGQDYSMYTTPQIVEFVKRGLNPNFDKGGVGKAFRTWLPMALSIAMPALAGPGAAGAAGAEAGAGGAAAGAAEAGAGSLAAGASEFVPQLAAAADPIAAGQTAMELTGTSTFTEAANALGFNSFTDLAGAINPAWIGAAEAGMSPLLKNTLLKSGQGAISNPKDPLKGAALGAVSANLPGLTGPIIGSAGMPEWATKGVNNALNSGIMQGLNRGEVDPRSLLQSFSTGASGGLGEELGIQPGILENLTGMGISGMNLASSNEKIRNMLAAKMLRSGRQVSDLGLNTPNQMLNPAVFLEQQKQQQEFNRRKEAAAARNAAIQEDFARRKQQAPTLNPELFSGVY